MDYLYDATENSFSGNTQESAELGQIMWHITNECRLNCAICFTRKMRENSSALSKEQIPQYLFLCKQLGVKKIDISGGEPLLYPHLAFLVNSCVQESIAVTITTSGMGTEENISWLTDNWSLFARIILSLDGTESIHNSLRRSHGAYAAFLNLFRKLSDSHCTVIRVNTIVTTHLLLDTELDSICDLIKRFSPREWCLIEPYPINQTSLFKDFAITNEEYLAVVRKCKENLHSSEIHIKQRTNDDFSSYWSLFCDGFLYYSQNRNSYDIQVKFDSANIKRIQRYVSLHPQTYILPFTQN